MEVWKEYGDYKVSNQGRVELSSGRITKGWNKNQYLGVNFGGNKEYVHRVVASLFCEGYFEGAQVDHIDGDKHNNRSCNLRWVTASENMFSRPKSRLYNKKLTEREITCAVRLSQNFGLNNTDISFALGIDRRTVSRILLGRTHSNVTGIEYDNSI